MKILFRIGLSVAALAFAGGAAAFPRSATLDIRNVSCAACAPMVKATLSRMSGVSQVSVVERDGSATANVVFDDEKVTAEALAKATTEVGFPSKVRSVKNAMSTGTGGTASR